MKEVHKIYFSETDKLKGRGRYSTLRDKCEIKKWRCKKWHWSSSIDRLFSIVLAEFRSNSVVDIIVVAPAQSTSNDVGAVWIVQLQRQIETRRSWTEDVAASLMCTLRYTSRERNLSEVGTFALFTNLGQRKKTSRPEGFYDAAGETHQETIQA